MHTAGYGARLTGMPPPLCPVALVIGMRALVCHTPAVITLGPEDNIPISAQFIGCIHHTRKAGFAVPLCVQKWTSATHSEQHKRLSQYTQAFSKLQVMPIGAMPYSSIVCVCVRTHVPVSVCMLYVGDGSVGLSVYLWRPEVDRGVFLCHSLILWNREFGGYSFVNWFASKPQSFPLCVWGFYSC